ncbi:HutD family protein [Nocardioides carbamazepini]|jgi:environmental stress-induced protein Ves|uniref:HutD/Ves family protein n=1 Tax=Nocardioides carbamazepini TaxID=2854259 RepID=UPI002149BD6B|nr:HutD family protein [Nocardioides carbamazepini]MCR1785681.1 HutD family protein [Nocardioides carbamazepini]
MTTTSTTITRAGDLRRVPWRNGQGMTTEIALGGDPDDFGWRVSLAEVARSGDFSPFPGIDRIIVLIEGAAMTLHLPGHTQVLRPDEPFGFDGGVPVRCTVEQPTRDLNVMTRRGVARATLDVRVLAEDAPPVVVPASGTVVLVVLDGTVRLAPGTTLETGDVAVGDEPVVLSGVARVAVARIESAEAG